MQIAQGRWQHRPIAISFHYKKNPRVTPYPFRRDDKIIQTDVAIWNPKWHYWGLMPKLNFSRYQIVSNMPAFYSRKSQRVYLSVEKRF